jgi:transposase InsO family protein
MSIICELLEYRRANLYYAKHPSVDESSIKALIREVAGRYPRYGYRRITQQLKREGHKLNHKRIARLMGEMGLCGKAPKRRQRTTQSNHGYGRYPNLVSELVIDHPEQVWVADITYIRLAQEFVYLAVVMDVFTRNIRGWHLSRSMEVSLTITALKKGLEGYRPEIHHSDQGVQYAASEYVELLRVAEARISMAEVGAAWQNGYAERLMRTIKEEEVDLSEYRNFAEAYEQIGRFLDKVYSRKRIHSSLGYLTPSEYEMQWKEQQGRECDIKKKSP